MKDWDVASIRAEFEARHQRQFGHHQPDGKIEIVHLRLVGIALISGAKRLDFRLTKDTPVPYEQRSVHLDMQSGSRMLPVYDGNLMRPGHALQGPALIDESNTTILIGAGDRLEIDASNNFLIHVSLAGGAMQ